MWGSYTNCEQNFIIFGMSADVERAGTGLVRVLSKPDCIKVLDLITGYEQMIPNYDLHLRGQTLGWTSNRYRGEG